MIYSLGMKYKCIDCGSFIGNSTRTGRRCLKHFRERERQRYHYRMARIGKVSQARSSPVRNSSFPAKSLSKYREKKFGITYDELCALYLIQDGCCFLCKAYLSDNLKKWTNYKRAAVDHDHCSGKTRGLLCTRCNGILGYVEKRAGMLERMAEYISYPPFEKVKK